MRQELEKAGVCKNENLTLLSECTVWSMDNNSGSDSSSENVVKDEASQPLVPFVDREAEKLPEVTVVTLNACSAINLSVTSGTNGC
ncbi:Transcription termination/antitermination protein NusA [Trichinella pseudospiralis]